jgi:hypothetical protein
MAVRKEDMSNVVKLKPKPRRVNLVRSRDEALHLLFPKLLGVLWESGKADTGAGAVHGKVSALLDESKIEVGGFILGRGTFAVHVYAPTARSPFAKVFSAHLGDTSLVDSRLFPYWGGRCSILSWKRGPWEDRIVADKAEPKTAAHLFTAGLARQR